MKLIKVSVFVLLLSSITFSTVFAEEDTDRVIIEEVEDRVVSNYLEDQEIALTYIDEHLRDSYETMYIDWDENNENKLVFLFRDPVDTAHQEAIRALVEEPSAIVFDEVLYTKEELIAKQKEIEAGGLEYDNFTINYLSSNVMNGTVNVGIVPYSEENAQILYQAYGNDMIVVEQGDEFTTMEMGIMARTSDQDAVEEIKEEEEEELNFFQRLFRAIRSWFPW
ncbi:hypothetical protein J2T56_001493 [Natronobacillus azotifigens]|uniref:DUF4252 domain-containing protein n=1 Tax=Natronobacillus azotifigens TaxID=472978 RepID=A0A9J6RCZ9_9BACI|nr:hypothetical protein [Natronobacillus azotifigens]MCZ0703227.1 hypothetical protein [Natronobacillus azotifigens]